MNVRVAIVGLGRVGTVFLQRLLSHQRQGLEIVAVADRSGDSPAERGASAAGIPVFRDGLELARSMGSHVDVLFDLTGNAEFRRRLRELMVETDNRHTVIAPESVAHLVWALIADGDGPLPDLHGHKGY